MLFMAKSDTSSVFSQLIQKSPSQWTNKLWTRTTRLQSPSGPVLGVITPGLSSGISSSKRTRITQYPGIAVHRWASTMTGVPIPLCSLSGLLLRDCTMITARRRVCSKGQARRAYMQSTTCTVRYQISRPSLTCSAAGFCWTGRTNASSAVRCELFIFLRSEKSKCLNAFKK